MSANTPQPTILTEERTDLGLNCPARIQRIVRLEKCEIGCQALRGSPVPIYGCQLHTECAPYRFQRNPTVRTCIECVSGGLQTISDSGCSGC